MMMSSKITVRAFTPTPMPPKTVHGQSTSARAMSTIDMQTGRVFYEHNADAKLPLASTTKIVTAITVIEEFERTGRSLDEKFTIHDKSIGIEGTSIYLQKGESMTARELLLGLMLRSGNDAGQALAFAVAPSIAEFATLMNQTAQKAGATNSSFKNPHGLDEEGHYTTARDLAKISAYAMRNATFAEIVKTTEARIDGVEYPRVIQNKNRLLKSLDGCVGIKTGFTKKSGRCYVSALNTNGQTTICVVLNCGPMFEEAQALMIAASHQFPMRKLVTAEEFIKFTEGCESGTCAIAIEDFYYPLADVELETRISITLEGEEVVIKLDGKEIYRAQCNVV